MPVRATKMNGKSMRFLYNKEEILMEIGRELELEEKEMESGDTPRRLHEARHDLFSKLLVKAKEMEFLELSPEGDWYYLVLADIYGAKVQLSYSCEEKNKLNIQGAIFAEVKAKFITADEYGAFYNYPGDTIRRWIRRGKLPSAQKLGRSWVISQIEIPKGRGYAFRTYEWDRAECIFEGDMAFLNAYDGISLEQLKDGRFFLIPRTREACGLFANVVPLSEDMNQTGFVATQREKEHFELKLIENPFVKVLTRKLRERIISERQLV